MSNISRKIRKNNVPIQEVKGEQIIKGFGNLINQALGVDHKKTMHLIQVSLPIDTKEKANRLRKELERIVKNA